MPPQKQKTKRKEWMTEDILKKMEERKNEKKTIEKDIKCSTNKYIKCATNQKEDWISENCAKIEELED